MQHSRYSEMNGTVMLLNLLTGCDPSCESSQPRLTQISNVPVRALSLLCTRTPRCSPVQLLPVELFHVFLLKWRIWHFSLLHFINSSWPIPPICVGLSGEWLSHFWHHLQSCWQHISLQVIDKAVEQDRFQGRFLTLLVISLQVKHNHYPLSLVIQIGFLFIQLIVHQTVISLI